MSTLLSHNFPSRTQGPGFGFLFAVIVLVLFAVLFFVALVPGLSGGSPGASWNTRISGQ